uniref:Ig-like domain-containing protein n=1 Tax=Melopsittacus undulatus TaxID=13146 RepID=A0A8V5GLJ4_MELUD
MSFLAPTGTYKSHNSKHRGPGASVSRSTELLLCRTAHPVPPLFMLSIWWYRQVPGGRLEWVSYISFDSSVIKFVQSVERRANISRDNSRSESSLLLSALQPQDSARYFCTAPLLHTETRKAAEL